MTTNALRPATTHPTKLSRAAAFGIGGALITIVGGTVAQIMRGSTSVSSDQWSFPFTARAFVLLAVVWALSHVLVYLGLDGMRRAELVDSRAGTVGIDLALAGTALLAVGELASMWLSDAKADAAGAIAVGIVFGLGTLLTAIGMVMLGVLVLRGRRWNGAGRWSVLAFGLVNLVQLALGPTDLFHVGIIAYGFAALWLMSSFRRVVRATT